MSFQTTDAFLIVTNPGRYDSPAGSDGTMLEIIWESLGPVAQLLFVFRSHAGISTAFLFVRDWIFET